VIKLVGLLYLTSEVKQSITLEYKQTNEFELTLLVSLPRWSCYQGEFSSKVRLFTFTFTLLKKLQCEYYKLNTRRCHCAKNNSVYL